MTTELILLSGVSCRGQEITSPRLRGLLALLAGDLRPGCSTARLVDGGSTPSVVRPSWYGLWCR